MLSPVRPDGELTTVYRPETNRFAGDVDLHWDAERMLFSMPGGHDRYQVFEINVDGSGLRQVTPTAPDIDNYDACYLPNEKIIFDSTACLQGVPCVGGGNQVANLYNRRNPFVYVFDYDAAPATRTGVSQIPLLPTFGVEFWF